MYVKYHSCYLHYFKYELKQYVFRYTSENANAKFRIKVWNFGSSNYGKHLRHILKITSGRKEVGGEIFRRFRESIQILSTLFDSRHKADLELGHFQSWDFPVMLTFLFGYFPKEKRSRYLFKMDALFEFSFA